MTYQNNAELALAFRMIPALAFEQLDRIDESFEKVVGEIMDVCDRYKLEQDIIDKTDQLLTYFQNYYIKQPSGRNVMFPPFLWNQKLAAANGIARTTNAVEGWHFGIQAFFSGSHPSIWKVLVGLRKDSVTQKKILLQARAGENFPKRKKYREINEKVQKVMSHYEETRRFGSKASLCFTLFALK